MFNHRRPRVNFFTPLPPALTEIANHSMALLPELARHMDLRVWVAQRDYDSPADPRVEIIPYKSLPIEPARLNWADVNIYNLGNNGKFHLPIFRAMLDTPGIVILHDITLQYLFIDLLLHPGEDRNLYLRLMHRFGGAGGLEDARAFLNGTLHFERIVERHPMTRAACDGQLAVISHNSAATNTLSQQCKAPAFEIPLSQSFGPMLPRPSSTGFPRRLVMFGHLGPNRRLASVLQAIAGLPNPGAVRLDVYGGLPDRGAMEDLIRKLGLERLVTLHGFVHDNALDHALHTADLALNLRMPTMGEASASQLRLWSAGLASTVTKAGWYATLPPDTVFFVDPDHEIDDLQRHILALIDAPLPFQQAGYAGRKRLEQFHTPRAYAEKLAAIIAQFPDFHARLHAQTLARHSADCLRQLAPDGATDLFSRRIAQRVFDVTAPETI